MWWFQLIQSIAIVVTLVVVFVQMRAYLRSLGAITCSEAAGKYYEVLKLLVEKPGLLEKIGEEFDKDSVLINDQTSIMLSMLFTFYEWMYLQSFEYKFMNKDYFKKWSEMLRDIFASPYVRGYWKARSKYYDDRFVKYINRNVE